jgi:multiple sugar transport system substrate-binding protein
MKKRSLSILVALVMLLGMMMTGSAVAEGKVSLRWVGAGWSQNDKAKNILAKWETIHPDINVEYIELGALVDEGYLANLDTMISGGEVVDVTYLTYSDVYKRVINGGALPLDPYIAEANDDYEAMYGTMSTAMLSYQDQIYGVPYAGNTFKVFYNKTMTDAAGIEIPETWSINEFTEVAKKLNNEEQGIYGCIFPYTWNAICYVPAELSGWTPVKKLDDGSIVPNFDDETFKTSMKWCRDLSLEEKIAPDLAIMKSESINRRQALVQKKTTMIIDGPFTLVWLQNYMFNDPGEGKLDFELGVTNVPYIDERGAEVSHNTIAGAFYVPKSAKYPAEAYAFAKFICNDCNQETSNYMPIFLQADLDKAAATFTKYTDKKGNKHTDVYPLNVAVAAVSTPFEAHIGKYNYDPSLATYTSLMTTLFGEQYALYLNDEMNLDDWVNMMQELGAAELSRAN